MHLDVVALGDAQLQHGGADFSCKDIFIALAWRLVDRESDPKEANTDFPSEG